MVHNPSITEDAPPIHHHLYLHLHFGGPEQDDGSSSTNDHRQQRVVVFCDGRWCTNPTGSPSLRDSRSKGVGAPLDERRRRRQR